MNYKNVYDKCDEEYGEECVNQKPKERRLKKFREKSHFAAGSDSKNQKFFPEQ